MNYCKNKSDNLKEYYESEFLEHIKIAQQVLKQSYDKFSNLFNLCMESISLGGKIIFFGNGGSAADSQHLATELTVKYLKNRKAIPAVALTTDTSTLTAIGNDFSFDQLFVRQIQALGKAEDLAIGISTSGKSNNVILALKEAKKIGMKTAALLGNNNNAFINFTDVVLCATFNTSNRVQEMHIILGHILCGALEKKLSL